MSMGRVNVCPFLSFVLSGMALRSSLMIGTQRTAGRVMKEILVLLGRCSCRTSKRASDGHALSFVLAGRQADRR
eukprot:scaffold587_cov171-Amphora_coffeaeformis.AAC.11